MICLETNSITKNIKTEVENIGKRCIKSFYH